MDSSVPVDKDRVRNESREQFKSSYDVNMDDDGLAAAHKESFVQIFNEHANVYVGPDGKLGFCEVIEQEIYVEEGAKPFYQ